MNMFSEFGKFEKILVTGPQRSGTRICAKMIAHDTGHKYVDEAMIGVDSLYRLKSLFERKQRIVVQCPALCRHIHMFRADNCAIIIMLRNVKDIVASQKRIGWNWENVELERYDQTEGLIAEIKYAFWKKYQKEKIGNAFEIEYESLARHKLWVSKNLRRDFGNGQTSFINDDLAVEQNAFLSQVPGVLCWEDGEHETARLVKTKGPVKLLNDSGQLIWSLCDGTRTLNDILAVLKNHFSDVDSSTLGYDFERFIHELVSQGFLQILSNKKDICS